MEEVKSELEKAVEDINTLLKPVIEKPVERDNMVFFGNHGITSTAATHLCELAQETLAFIRSTAEQTSFVDTFVEIVGSDAKPKQTKKGYDPQLVETIEKGIETVARLNGFCAWMRSAVKVKDEVIARHMTYSFPEWAEDNGIKLPREPKAIESVSEEDVIASMPLTDRLEYYMTEARAAAYGKYIHPGEPLSEARKSLQDAITNPIDTEGEGSSLLIYSYKPSVSKESVDELFFKLQAEHREAEARLNRIKSKIKTKRNKLSVDATHTYKEEYNKVEAIKANLYTTYKKWHTEELERLSSLKIVVPAELQETFDYLSSLDSKK